MDKTEILLQLKKLNKDIIAETIVEFVSKNPQINMESTASHNALAEYICKKVVLNNTFN